MSFPLPRARLLAPPLLALAALLPALALAGAARGETPARRVVSLNPSLTAIVLALGARDALVGVDAFSARQQPSLAQLPTVGGLYDPSLEAVVALHPDLVVLVPSAEQRGFRTRLAELGIARLALDPLGWDEVLASIRELGARLGRQREAGARIAAIEATRAEIEAAVSALPRPRTLLVLQRDPLFIVGRGSFVDAMLGAAGAENLGAELGTPWPRVGREWLLARAPEVLFDASPGAAAEAKMFWARWPSLPAVRDDRVIPLDGLVTLPGPQLDRALRRLAHHLHGLPLELESAPARTAAAP